MKRAFSILSASAIALAAFAYPDEGKVIRISTDNIDLVLKVGENGRLYQTYLGSKLLNAEDAAILDWA